MESQIFGPRCFRDLLALTVEAICQMYPPRVAARVAWEWASLTGSGPDLHLIDVGLTYGEWA